MIRKTVGAVGMALVLAGCSSTIAGTPVADPSSVPRPDTGSFPTTVRTLGTPDESEYLRQEWLRTLAAIPYISDVDPALRYGGSTSGGRYNEKAFASIFGSAPAKRLVGAELWAGLGVRSAYPKSGGDRGRSLSVALVRMASPEAATAAVSSAMLEPNTNEFGGSPPKKTAVPIPGYPNAVGYESDWGTSKPTVAFVPVKQFVLAVYGDFNPDQIRQLADSQAKGLADFAPTPMDKLNTLKIDESGVARYTLPPDKTNGYSAPVRMLIQSQNDVIAARKVLADNGVDVIGRGGNTVYRARDAAGARAVATQFVQEYQEKLIGAQAEAVSGVPGGTCVTYKSSGADRPDTETACVTAYDRYVVEYATSQKQKAIQGIGASYMILQAAK
ncbi:DUF7373 family lipoprotein [Tsukamurella strandjordii]|uniref:Uncharacterized protein n=1 Tax=Tsukamurella strandjordii TaxID=147577 RepID=A0AA90NH54_9ACTN|nr:hypothetical protein [Tsukamurella strandjordii]MDP0398354.1 hypothetical protein [Tsukamurella strandjordii]